MKQSRSQKTSWIVSGIFLVWVGLFFVLVSWWSSVLERQALEIASLKQALHIPEREIVAQLERTHRMIQWEFGAIVVLLLAIGGFLAWVYLREMRRSRSLQSFFAALTHELRTPLTSIRLQAEAITHSKDNQSTERLLSRLLEDTARLEHQVDRTLELARLEGGGKVYVENLSFQKFISDAITQSTETYGNKVQFQSEIPSQVSTDLKIQADRSALQVVFRNLVENSIRHAKQKKQEVKIRLFVEKVREWVVLRLQDDGKGFQGKGSDLGKLFHKGKESSGAGVGLYLVNSLMKRMGGKADFEELLTEPGFRTALWFKKANSS